jgi:DNA-directed RNA polymerase subunit M/transcription elongation factor TFIIS
MFDDDDSCPVCGNVIQNTYSDYYVKRICKKCNYSQYVENYDVDDFEHRHRRENDFNDF